MAEIEHVSKEEFMEEVARYEYVYHRNIKDFKDKNKRPTFRTKFSRSSIYRPRKRRAAKFRNIRTAHGPYRIQNRCFNFDGFGADDDVAS